MLTLKYTVREYIRRPDPRERAIRRAHRAQWREIERKIRERAAVTHNADNVVTREVVPQ